MFNPVRAASNAAREAAGAVSEAVRDPGKAADAFKDAVEDAAEDAARSPRRALDGVQGALDVAGFIPGVGILADLANAGISAARGDYAGAALNVLAAVPIVGDAAKGGKMAVKGLGAAADALKARDAARLGRPAPLQLPAGAPPPTALERARALPGHGHVRHGSETTAAQQAHRVQTGVAPDGPGNPVGRSTRFDSPEAELDAVSRARSRTAGRVADGRQSEAIIVKPNGEARLPRDASVVTGHPGGYGSGVEVARNPATGAPLPGRPVQPTGQDPNAFVVLERRPATGTWEPVTQYPTKQPVTP